MEEYTKSIKVNGKEMTFTTGGIAFRADSAVKVQYGETVVLAIVTVSHEESSLDYFPLSIEYIEKFYAGGIISGSKFVKRERRPSDEAILKARQVDHSIRSLFPKGFKKPVSVAITVLSYDEIHDPADLAVNAASAALMLSSVPFDGPSAAVSIGIEKDTGNLLINPEINSEEELMGHYIISYKDDRVLNIEGWSNEISEEKLDEILDRGAKEVKVLFDVQKELAKKHGKEKLDYPKDVVEKELLNKIEKLYKKDIENALFEGLKRQEIFSQIVEKFIEKQKEDEYSKSDVSDAVEYIARKIMRAMILEKEKRASGRKLDEVRPLDIKVGVLPRVHGSALFTRGFTQALSIVTLGSTRLSQTLESFEGEEEKRFMHHYNGPNYSTGEAGRFSYYPGRREIGHGHITENAVKAILPSEEEFPYTIRVVSEILSQNGSTSMASACGTSLALMDAGVPIKKAIAGIAIGLVTDDENVNNYKLLTDIEGLEDFYGDMDFKVVGTRDGINAIQLDNKLKGVPIEILKDALRASKKAREFVLEKMNKVISSPRSEVSKYAPKVDKLHIQTDKIGELIGPGGKVIKNIIEETEKIGPIDIDIQDDGDVYITSVSSNARDKAIKMIKEIFEEAEIGKEYDGTVERLESYGAFVKITKNIDGLVHISEVTDGFLADITKILEVGDKVRVKVIGIDEMGRVKLTMKGLNPDVEEKIKSLPKENKKRKQFNKRFNHNRR